MFACSLLAGVTCVPTCVSLPVSGLFILFCTYYYSVPPLSAPPTHLPALPPPPPLQLGNTALIHAAAGGHTEAVRLLLTRPDTVDNLANLVRQAWGEGMGCVMVQGHGCVVVHAQQCRQSRTCNTHPTPNVARLVSTACRLLHEHTVSLAWTVCTQHHWAGPCAHSITGLDHVHTASLGWTTCTQHHWAGPHAHSITGLDHVHSWLLFV